MKKYLYLIAYLCFGLLLYGIIQIIFHDSFVNVIVSSIYNDNDLDFTKSSILPLHGYKQLHEKNNLLLDELLLSNNITPDLYDKSFDSKKSSKATNKNLDKKKVNYPININTATAQELETIPGIGHQIALRIIEYRDSNGPFTSLDQLLNIKGIGNKTLEKIKPFVILN